MGTHSAGVGGMAAGALLQVCLLSGIVANLLPGDLGRGTHHHLPHPHGGDHGGDHQHQHLHNHHGEQKHQEEHHAHRKGKQVPGDDRVAGQLIDFSQAVEDPSTGLRCVVEEEVVESLEKERLLTCTHSMTRVCHYTYVTQFRPHRQKECSEYYEKTCNIVFTVRATNETVRKCYRPTSKVCNGEGEEVCQTVYESSCTTKYVEKSPGKFVGDTGCEKLPLEICGAGCTFEEGEEECHDKTITSTVSVPEESCDLAPQEKCGHVYRLVPFLSPTQECKEVPREVCTFGVLPGRPGERPLTTKWCYDPDTEPDLVSSGLDNSVDTAPPPTDPLTPPSDTFQFPQQDLPAIDYLDLPDLDLPDLGLADLDYLELPELVESGAASLSQAEDLPTYFEEDALPTYNPGGSRDNLFYIPPAPEVRQALRQEDRAGRKVQATRQGKLGARRPEEEEQEDIGFLEEFLETVKQDQEGPFRLRFGQLVQDEDGTEASRSKSVDSQTSGQNLAVWDKLQPGKLDRTEQLSDLIPEVFQFPDSQSRQLGDSTKSTKRQREKDQRRAGNRSKKNRKGKNRGDRRGKEEKRSRKDRWGKKGRKGRVNGGRGGVSSRRVEEDVPSEFAPILARIESRSQGKVRFVKGGPGEELEGHRAIARVIQHHGEGNPHHRTVVIQNSREAHQAFGIMNAPDTHGATGPLGDTGNQDHLEEAGWSGARKPSNKFWVEQAAEENGGDEANREEEALGDETDLVFSDGSHREDEEEGVATVRTIVIKNTAADFARFGVTNVPRELLTHLVQQERRPKAANRENKRGNSNAVETERSFAVLGSGDSTSTSFGQPKTPNKVTQDFGFIESTTSYPPISQNLVDPNQFTDSSAIQGGSSFFFPQENALGSSQRNNEGLPEGKPGISQLRKDSSPRQGKGSATFQKDLEGLPHSTKLNKDSEELSSGFSENSFFESSQFTDESVLPNKKTAFTQQKEDSSLQRDNGSETFQDNSERVPDINRNSVEASFTPRKNKAISAPQHDESLFLQHENEIESFRNSPQPLFSSTLQQSRDISATNFSDDSFFSQHGVFTEQNEIHTNSPEISISPFNQQNKTAFTQRGKSFIFPKENNEISNPDQNTFFQQNNFIQQGAFKKGSPNKKFTPEISTDFSSPLKEPLPVTTAEVREVVRTSVPPSPPISLPPVPEVVRPHAPSTKRPHTFVRAAAITKIQQFAQPGDTTLPEVLTNRPMTFQTASGKFSPPSTLLFGFKPMATSPLVPQATPPTAVSQRFSPPQVNFGFKPSESPRSSLDVRLAEGSERPRSGRSLGSSMLRRISDLLEPLTAPLHRLMGR